jgi:hypothetical protein
MTSGTPFPHNLTEIDKLTRPDHSYLGPDDLCYFLGEYTARKGFSHSDTNNLILNLKKDMSRRGRAEWQYKERAILTAAAALRVSISTSWLENATFVPVPPSKAKDDPLYDDRLTRVLAAINKERPVDCRELIVQDKSTDAVHESSHRLGPDDIYELYKLDKKLLKPPPQKILVVDDVLTTGAHFKAAKRILSDEFPAATIVGCFIARRVPEAIDVEEFFVDLDEE